MQSRMLGIAQDKNLQFVWGERQHILMLEAVQGIGPWVIPEDLSGRCAGLYCSLNGLMYGFVEEKNEFGIRVAIMVCSEKTCAFAHGDASAYPLPEESLCETPFRDQCDQA